MFEEDFAPINWQNPLASNFYNDVQRLNQIKLSFKRADVTVSKFLPTTI